VEHEERKKEGQKTDPYECFGKDEKGQIFVANKKRKEVRHGFLKSVIDALGGNDGEKKGKARAHSI